jgi:hypothetical protein
MDLSFSIKFDSGRERFSGLNGYDGAQALLGISQLFLISLNAYLNKDIITRAPSAQGFRLVLGPSRAGSWEQLVHVVITNAEVAATFADLGKDALYDLLKWGFLNGVGIAFAVGHHKSKAVISELQRKNEDLHDRLAEALSRAHYPVKNQGLTVNISAPNCQLVLFNQHTLDHLETEIVDDQVVAINVCISRFNARTGTGRMITAMESASIPFYPEAKLSDHRRALLADNLGLIARGQFEPIKVYVSRVTSIDGNLKKYILHGAETLKVNPFS